VLNPSLTQIICGFYQVGNKKTGLLRRLLPICTRLVPGVTVAALNLFYAWPAGC